MNQSTGSAGPSFLVSNAVNQETSPTIAKCGNKFLVAWSDSRNNFDTDIYGSVLDSTGTVVVSGIQIAGGLGDQDQPAAACDGSNFLVAWTDRRGGNPNIYYNIVQPTGALSFANGKSLTNAAETDGNPAVAYVPSPSSWWVVWSYNGTQIRGQRIATSTGLPSGSVTVIDPDDIGDKIGVIGFPDLDYDIYRNDLVVVWQGGVNNGVDTNIYGAHLSVTGTPSARFAIETNTSPQRYPVIRFNVAGQEATVAYEDDRTPSHGTDIYSRRVSGISVSAANPVAFTSNNEYRPRLTTRTGSTQELSFYRSTSSAFDYDSFGQTLVTGAPSGSVYSIASDSGIREMTPQIECLSTTDCISVFRQFSQSDNDIDRVKATHISGY